MAEDETGSYTTCLPFGTLSTSALISAEVVGLVVVPVSNLTARPSSRADPRAARTSASTSAQVVRTPPLVGYVSRRLS